MLPKLMQTQYAFHDRKFLSTCVFFSLDKYDVVHPGYLNMIGFFSIIQRHRLSSSDFKGGRQQMKRQRNVSLFSLLIENAVELCSVFRRFTGKY